MYFSLHTFLKVLFILVWLFNCTIYFVMITQLYYFCEQDQKEMCVVLFKLNHTKAFFINLSVISKYAVYSSDLAVDSLSP